MSKRKCPMPAIAGVVLLACVGVGRAQTLDQKINNAWTFAASQILATTNLSSLNAGGGDVLYPSSTSGYTTWKTINSTDQSSGWDSAFFPGQLWLLYNHTQNATFQTDAEKWSYPLQYSLNGSDPDKGIVLDEDAGFQTELAWGNALLYSTDPEYNGATAAATYVYNASYLDSRFLPEANGTGMIRSLGVVGNYSTVVWPQYASFSNSQILSLHINDASVIDHSMGTQCLFEAHVLDPNATTDVYYQNAITDAVTSAHEFVRDDGSSYHAIWYYDPTAAANLAGTVWGKGTEQGYANEGTWSRGQAWGTYAFTEDYFYTRNDPAQINNGNVSLFLSTAQNMANYFWNNLPANLSHSSADYVAGDYVPPSDFDATAGEQNTTTDQQGNTYYDANGNGVFNQSVSGTSGSKGSYVNDRFVGLGTYTERDTSAAAIEAAAMLQLALYEPNHTLGLQYYNEAGDILGSLLTESSTSGNGETDYFAENTSGKALGVGLLLKYSLQWTASSSYASSAYGDYYLLQAMTDYQSLEAQWFPNENWSAAVTGNWVDTTKWSSSSAPTSILGATFNTGSVTPYTVTLTGASSAQTLTVGDNVTIQKAGNNLTVGIDLNIAGTPTQAAKLTLAGAGVTTAGSLNIAYGQLDITDNQVVINYGVGNPSPAGSIGAYITSGYNGGTWSGAGIVSSKVASVNTSLGNAHAYAIGYADASDPAVAVDHFTPGTVVIEPAIVGDANLDGVVNYTDFQLLAANFNSSNTSWDQGNFNYGTGTSYTDFQLLAANFNDSTSLDSAEFDAMNQFAKGFGDSLVPNADGNGFTVVPEPAMGAILLLVGAGTLTRRRRNI